MNTKTFLTPILVLLGLIAATVSAFFLGQLFPEIKQVPVLGLPSLSPLNLPPQTVNGFTAQVESYYADASRLVFVVRINSDTSDFMLDSASIREIKGPEINAGYGVSPYLLPSTYMIDFVTAQSFPEDHLNGQLAFKVTEPEDWAPLADFQFDLDIPIHPEITLEPKQTVWANGVEMLLDRVVITPSYTNAYLCYPQPTEGDWIIGQDTTLSIDSQVGHLGTYSLLFDTALGDGSKGGEPGWTPPVQDGRCVKIGFPVGSADPKSLTLTIPALEQSTPEVIPEDDIAAAQERLKAEGIDMEWHTVDHGAYPEYKNLPAGMSEAEAYRQFIRALGYVHPGSWTFEVPLESQPKFSTSSYGAPEPLPAPDRIEPAITLKGCIRSFDLRPDENAIAFATSKGVVVYDFDTKKTQILNEKENFFGVDWSPDGKKLSAGSLVMRAEGSGAPHMIVWNTTSWKTIYELDSDRDDYAPFGALEWSPDSNLLAFSFADRGLIVLNIKTGKTVAEQTDYLFPPDDISWSSDGSRLLTTGDLGFGFRRWRLDTNEHVRLYDPRAGSAPIRLAWSPDGERIASAHAMETVCIWTVSTNKCDGLIYAHQNLVSGLAWSPDGSQLATGGGVIRIWNSQTGELLKGFGLTDHSIYSQLAWLTRDLFISLEVGYGRDAPTLVRFWDLKTGNILTEFEGQTGEFGD